MRWLPACGRIRVALALASALAFAPLAAQEPQPSDAIFRSTLDLVSIDVVVRDRSGAIVTGLTPADFEIREDGRSQELLTLSFEEVSRVPALQPGVPLLDRLGLPAVSPVTPPAGAAATSGRRLMLLLFDLSVMAPEDLQRSVQAAMSFVDTRMSPADAVAIATLTWELSVLTDFTGDRETVRRVLAGLVPVDVSTGADSNVDLPDDGTPAAGPGVSAVAATDARLRAVRLLADALAPVPQKKALLYFTSGMGNAATDTPAELRAATTAAARANMAIYPVDARGLQAVIPSGPALTGSRGGQGLFSGQDVNDQFDALTSSQDTMVSMASATGGRMFSGANDVSAAFVRVQEDTAAYYLLGYSSTNGTRDGRYRRIQVRVRREGLRVEARNGYYPARDFAYSNRTDREAQLEEQLRAADDALDLAVRTRTGWFRTAADEYRVGIGLILPVRPPSTTARNALDVLAVVEDEQGRAIARVRETLDAPSGSQDSAGLAYSTSLVLPPGQFTLRAVVRENSAGRMGSARAVLRVPHLPDGLLAASTPIVHEGDGGASLYVEVYGARTPGPSSNALVATSTWFRDGARVADLALIATPARPGAPPGVQAYGTRVSGIAGGSYTCQITVADPSTGQFAIIRAELDIP